MDARHKIPQHLDGKARLLKIWGLDFWSNDVDCSLFAVTVSRDFPCDVAFLLRKSYIEGEPETDTSTAKPL
jgi:hypothetical protein